MSVPVQDPINQVIIVGSETEIPWLWNLQKETEITVLVQRESDGSIDTLVLNTDYTVEANDLDKDGGGNITPIGDESPVTAGDIWTLFRVTAIDRSPDFATSGAFFAKTINEQLDELTRIAQDINRDSAEAVRKDPGVGDELDRNIPQMIAGRTLKFIETESGKFKFIMSETDPDDGSVQTVAGLYATVFPTNSSIGVLESQNGFEVRVDTSGGDVDITLPDSSGLSADFRVGIVKTTSDSNVINVKVQGSDTVNGGTSDIVQSVANRRLVYVLDQSTASYLTDTGQATFLSEVRVISSTPITLALADNGKLLSVDTSSGDIDINLPDSSTLSADFRVSIEKSTADINVVNVKVAGSDKVNNDTADIVQNTRYNRVAYVLDQSAGTWTVSLLSSPPPIGDVSANTIKGSTLETEQGLTFPATQNPSGDAHTLDDYEEGTWTPVLEDSSGNSATMDDQIGTYVKIGALVFLSGTLSTTSVAGLDGTQLTIHGIPFTTKDETANASGAMVCSNGTSLSLSPGNSLVIRVPENSTFLAMEQWGNAAGAVIINATTWTSNGGVSFSGTYIASS